MRSQIAMGFGQRSVRALGERVRHEDAGGHGHQ